MKARSRFLLCLFLVLGIVILSAADQSRDGTTVQRRDFSKRLTFSGELQAAESLTVTTPSVRSQWNFSVNFIAEAGTEVHAGDLLLEFDTSQLELRRLDVEKRREEARIKITQKEAEIEGRRQEMLLERARAEKDLKISRLKSEIDPNLISRFDAEKYRYESEKAQIAMQKSDERLRNLKESSRAEMDVVLLEFQQADLELKRIVSDVNKMSVRAPSHGIVLHRENWQTGRSIQVGDSVHQGQPLMYLPNLSRLVVAASVHHSDLGRLRDNAAAQIVLDAYPNRTFKGRVISLPEVARSRHSQSQFKFFVMKVLLEEVDPVLMKPGMTARVHIQQVQPDALLVPRTTLRLDSQGRTYVLLDTQPPTRVDVEVRDSDHLWAWVEGDLDEGGALLKPESASVSGSQEEIDWIRVETKDLDFHISGSGQLRAGEAVSIRPPSLPNSWRFKIARLAPEGSDVKPGDFLVQFDPTDFMKRVRDESSNLEKVRKELEKTESSFILEMKDLELQLEQARVEEEKSSNNLIKAREFEPHRQVREARVEAEFARYQTETLAKKLAFKKTSMDLQLEVLREKEKFYQARVKVGRESIRSLTLTAPIQGVLVYIPNWRNEKRKVGSEISIMENFLSIPNLSTLRIEGQIAEVDAGRVELGDRVSVTLDAMSEDEFQGRVVEIGSIFRKTSPRKSTRVLDVTIELDAPDPESMRPGMAARLQIAVESFPAALAVPLSVIQVDGDRSYVWVKSEDGPVKTEVTLGKENGIVAVVESGLREGAEVASRPLKETG